MITTKSTRSKKKTNSTGKHPGGRPSIYDSLSEREYRLIMGMYRLGSTDVQVAEAIGITERTITNWKNEYPEFFLSLKEQKEEADEEVVQSLFERACGYSHPEDKIFYGTKEGKAVTVITTKHYPPDVTACIFWLKNRLPDKWRDKIEYENKGTINIEQELLAGRRRVGIEGEYSGEDKD